MLGGRSRRQPLPRRDRYLVNAGIGVRRNRHSTESSWALARTRKCSRLRFQTKARGPRTRDKMIVNRDAVTH